MEYLITLKNRALNSRLVNDSFWALFGNIVAKGLALAAGIIVARFLGKDIFGEYGIIRNTIMSVAIFSTFGLGYTATKYIAEYKNSNPEYIQLILRYTRNITLIVSGIMALGLFIGASYIANTVLEAVHLTTPLRYVAIWIVFNAITTTQIGVLAGFGAFKEMAKINTIVGIVTFISSLIFTYLWHLNGALAALLISQIINWYFNYQLVKEYTPKQKATKKDKVLYKHILNFSLPVALQEATYSITSWATSLLLIKLSTYGELGLYSAAMQWNAIILFIPGVLRNVILSHFAEATDNENRHNRILKITLLFNLMVTLLPFLFVFSLADYIVIFYGQSFVGLKSVINIAVFTTIFLSLSNVYAQAYLSIGKTWLMFGLRLIRDLGILLLAYLLLYRNNGEMGAQSLAISALIWSILFFIIMASIYKINN